MQNLFNDGGFSSVGVSESIMDMLGEVMQRQSAEGKI
jgi:hypothetical protein